MKSERRIRLIVGISDFRIGGAQKVVADLINHFDKTKFKIHLLTFFDSANEENFFNEIDPEILIHKLSFKNFYDIKSIFLLYKLLKNIDADVVWSHLFFSNTLIRVLKPLFRFRVVIVEHNTYVYRTKIEKIVNYILSFVTFKIVAVSNYVAKYTSKDESISLRKFVVIHNGVDTKKLIVQPNPTLKDSLYRELGFSYSSKFFLNIGQLTTQKNQKLLVEAFSLVTKIYPEYKLVILGEGNLRKELEALVSNLDLTQRVIMPGIKKDVVRYYAASHCFVLSSDFEGFPIVAIEALVSGLPIISTPVSASDVYVSDGRNGFIARQSSKESLAEKMCRICEMEEKELDAFRSVSKEISTEFDIADVVKRYESLLVEASS